MRWIFYRVVREGLTQKVIFEQDLVEVESEPGECLGEEYFKHKEQVQKALRQKHVKGAEKTVRQPLQAEHCK